MATPSRPPKVASSTSFASTSSFCWTSPCTFSAPALPRTFSSRARRTLSAMIFAEIDRADRIQEKVPEACG